MTVRVAINGYGRIGRNILRAHYEGGKKHDIQIVAINDLGKPETNAHLTRYDTAHGKFPGKVAVDGDSMVRARCGNRLSEKPLEPVHFSEAPEDVLQQGHWIIAHGASAPSDRDWKRASFGCLAFLPWRRCWCLSAC